MPKALIDLSEHTDRIVNIIKARDGLRNKSEAIERIVEDYEQQILDPALRPDFAAELQRIRKGDFRDVEGLQDL